MAKATFVLGLEGYTEEKKEKKQECSDENPQFIECLPSSGHCCRHDTYTDPFTSHKNPRRWIPLLSPILWSERQQHREVKKLAQGSITITQ